MSNQIFLRRRQTFLLLLLAVLKASTALPISADEEEHSHTQSAQDLSERYDPSNPIYELQLAVWPTDFEDIVDGLQDAFQDMPVIEAQDVVYPDYEPEGVLPTKAPRPQKPIYADQFPQFDYENHGAQVGIVADHWWSTTSTSTRRPTTKKPTEQPTKQPTQRPDAAAGVIERYHKIFPNGNSEYKLVLSNGMVNYKKIFNKRVNGKLITVQRGYDTMPVPGHRNQYHTQYYVADETGHNVYKVEQHTKRDAVPGFEEEELVADDITGS